MADKDFTSLLGRSSGSSWGDIAGAYLSGGRKKDNRAKNVLLATLFFKGKEADMQSKVMKNLQELEEQKTLELAKLNKQWDKRTELQTEYDNIQKNGAFKTYQTKLEEDFKNAHLENKEIINMSSGAIADYKLNWMNNQAKKYEDDFMQRYQGIDKDITVKEEFTKPYMDYYKAQKEKIKELQGNIHVLTLTATPIPRTLQLSLSGLKQLSLISTPPVDRLSIRTFVFEWDKVVLLDALNREKNRGGQSFIVCPRIKDIDGLYEKVKKMAPNLSIKVAHGQMKIDELDSSINSFADGKSDVLISTNIIESGIDIPNANTMIIYKSDMFGLSQLYQLRGRIGRGKKRAYAYFTVEAGKVLNKNSQQRLDVIKTLDNLGAGFSLASYDMDIRGAGNLLGDEQSGQIKEVGVELYQDMLKDAVYSYKNKEAPLEEVWSPSISLGLAVLIPDTYVYDLSTRMALYRKAGDLRSSDEINEFNEELAKAGRVADFLELGELFAKDALERNESCGGHFREEYQTKEGEATRKKEFQFVSASV